jgi:hypothetical protein
VLLSALVMLVALMLGAAALMRMVESANLLSGNLAFKRGATLAAEAGAEAAISWLAQQGAGALAQDLTGHGYYASDAEDFDAGGNRSGSRLTRVDWQGDNCTGAVLARCLTPAALAAPDVAGHTVRYVIQRLCKASGQPAVSGDCAFHMPVDADSSSRTGLSYGQAKRFGGPPLGYYRITARAGGPRNTVGLLEVLVRF